jgi:hypothetical protein
MCHHPPPIKTLIDRQRAADKAYDAAMHKIPDKKSSADVGGAMFVLPRASSNRLVGFEGGGETC